MGAAGRAEKEVVGQDHVGVGKRIGGPESCEPLREVPSGARA